ncbi:hypothetical protein [Spongiactinospora sp. TRM90649]|uniref:hypothetical protein n=1 Tax=Spongiactinospora sp. TRM90649 TaxID=3031114 RepID=UPI0023F6931A|nr:hypothetical protein [Spongiactinospora sp. TRM90649]MDF5752949.1 hypothetical protein [Spongiactinospora sp. TRM90649]
MTSARQCRSRPGSGTGSTAGRRWTWTRVGLAHLTRTVREHLGHTPVVLRRLVAAEQRR